LLIVDLPERVEETLVERLANIRLEDLLQLLADGPGDRRADRGAFLG
jgi:hypothetical protein